MAFVAYESISMNSVDVVSPVVGSATGDASAIFFGSTPEGDRIIFEYPYLLDELRGRCLTVGLLRTAFSEARNWRRWLVLGCLSVAKFIKRNPEFADLPDRESVES